MRIISLVPSVTETLFELGLGDQIVAITRWCTRPADQVIHKPKVGGTKNPKLDSIASFEPDVVILDCDENRKEDAESLARLGINTLSVFPKNFEDSVELIRTLGKRFGVEAKSSEMISEMEQLRNAYHPIPYPHSMILIWRSPYMTFNSDTYANAASILFGFQNQFGNHPQRYPSLTSEEIRRANPSVVLFPDEPYPFQPKHVEAFRSEFPELRAVKQNQLLLFDGSYIAWHGFGTLRALREFPSILAERLS